MTQVLPKDVPQTLRRWKRYPAYKDSCVEWLGEIPEHWQAYKLKRVSEISYGLTLELDRTETEGTFIISLPNVTKGGQLVLEEVPKTQLTDEEKKSLLLRKGDLLFNWRNGSSDHVGKTAYFDAEGEYTHVSFLLRLRFDLAKHDSRYYHMFINNLRNTDFFASAKTRVNNTYNQAELRQLEVIVPPRDEQQAIASFLDRETAKIDALIAKKERLIQLLQEKRTTIISHAVTKGLDPTASLKDSGVEWLGKIPKHWEVKQIKHLSSIFVPQRNKPELNQDTGLPWITMDDITYPSVCCSTTGYYVSEADALKAGSKALPAGCVIASCVGNFGVASVNTAPIIINQQLQAYIPKKINPWFLRYLVTVSKPYFEKVATATTLVYVNRERFGEMPVVLPSCEEQQAIASYLDRETAKIDALIAKIREGIEKLKEYRTALISAAVTGKIDVRNEVAS